MHLTSDDFNVFFLSASQRFNVFFLSASQKRT